MDKFDDLSEEVEIPMMGGLNLSWWILLVIPAFIIWIKVIGQ